MQVLMDAEALQSFFVEEFPQVGPEFVIDAVRPMEADVRLIPSDQHLRPGGTVSGPSMFGLVDVGFYVAVLAMIGPKALAVTTNATLDFMRKPAAGCDVICKVRLLKLGRQLAVGDALVFSDGSPDPVARANMTYAIPPK